ncbi:MAG: hypothetical protein H6812_03330 [Phycisphaeraceae bacterium]|nr:hypothetical protein [Phycisphaerales bacterium]MCB9842273.1 hypothetical protein [Phycisphaeraceae bacterium]
MIEPHAEHLDADPARPDTDRLTLIVVGAHLRAERVDRPIAYRLREHLLREVDALEADMDVMLCTDVWYLNNDALRARPTVSVGGPGVNALSAFLIDKVPTAFAIDDVLSIHMDVEDADPIACVWGTSAGALASGVDAFCERYAERFVRLASARSGGAG